MDSVSPSSRICQSCGGKHLQRKSPVCSKCRHKYSKKPCPVPGCDAQIGFQARTCLAHRRDPRFSKQDRYDRCAECGDAMVDVVIPVCLRCRRDVRVLCACGCGRYRQKYDAKGAIRPYISGHNDAWAKSRRPPVPCIICGTMFKAATSRSKLCSIECRAKWVAINPPNEKKRIPVTCDCCGKTIYRTPCEIREGASFACSPRCQYIIVANKNRGKNITQGKRLALQRDGGKCRICGFDVIVEVHHITPKRHGGPDKEHNLITLCPNHHTMADRGLITEDELRSHL